MDAADRVGEKVRLLRSPLRVQHSRKGSTKWLPAPDLRGKVGQIERHRNDRVKVTIQLAPGEYYVTDWLMESEIANAEETKQEPINPVMPQPRKLIAMLELNTHGTEEQMWKTYEKLKFELNLQGFKFTLSDEIQVRP
jgi:hypothetical protein